MTFGKLHSLLLISALILAAVSCEETGQKRTSVQPPAQAVAATVASAKPADPPKDDPPPQQAQVAPVEPKADPVPALVDQAEAEYQAGQTNYAAGHLDAAKVNFDNAVNILLSGPVDVRADERLQREFDKITEGVQQLEVLALQQGDGFTEQKAEPAPIDEANEVTFPADPNVTAKAAAEIKSTKSDLPLTMNDYVASYISYFSTRGHGTLEHAYERAGRYREMIERVFREEGVPQDLIYLAQAESGFHPLALSRAGARGMWQFMASRASAYGLERNWWVDERQDPEKSTRAAARHLKDLYNQFGDWYLAMAAYNSGPGTVQQGVQRTGYADFWQLYKRNVLPRETKNYVPIILAMTIMAKNPAQYGLTGVEPEAPPEVDTVKVDYPVDLRLVAECIDHPLADLQDLNPSLLRMTTPKGDNFELRLPAGTKEKYVAAIASIPVDKRVWWRYHKVEEGETLASIARKYRTTTKAIDEVNNLESAELQPDSKLIIPVTPGRSVDTLTFSRRATRYRVRKGDTVLSVADDFGVPPERLRKWNRLHGNTLRAGRSLLIYKPSAEEAPAAPRKASAKSKAKSKKSKSLDTTAGSRRIHKVRPGETLSSIADQYNTTVDQLRRDNHLASARLRAGDTLVITSDRGF